MGFWPKRGLAQTSRPAAIMLFVAFMGCVTDWILSGTAHAGMHLVHFSWVYDCGKYAGLFERTNNGSLISPHYPHGVFMSTIASVPKIQYTMAVWNTS